MIRFECAGCRQTLEVSDESAGREVTCAVCGTKQVLPNEPPMVFAPPVFLPLRRRRKAGVDWGKELKPLFEAIGVAIAAVATIVGGLAGIAMLIAGIDSLAHPGPYGSPGCLIVFGGLMLGGAIAVLIASSRR